MTDHLQRRTFLQTFGAAAVIRAEAIPMASEFRDSEHFASFNGRGALRTGNSYGGRWSEITLAALRSVGFLDNMVDGLVPPIDNTLLWLDKTFDPAVLKQWDPAGRAWVQVTSETLFVRVGVTAGMVAAGDDSRFGITTFAEASSANIPSTVSRVFVEDRRAYFIRVESEPAHTIKFNNGGWFSVDDIGITPLAAGAVGNGQLGASAADDTAALQAVLSFFRNTRPATRHRDNQRVLDLLGRQYRVSRSLSLEGCDGVEIRNGTLIVDPSTSFAANRAVLEHNVSANELWGLTLNCVTIQCNQTANGILINRPQETFFINPTVLGWGQREYGVRLGPVSYSADVKLQNPRISGFAVSYADNPWVTRTGIGIDLQTADTEILGGSVDTGLVPIRIHSSGSVLGSHVWNGQPGEESSVGSNAIAIEYVDGHNMPSLISGNIFDNSCIVINGESLYKQIVGNKFYGSRENLEAGIIIKSSGANQVIADLQIQANQFHSYYKRPVLIDETAAPYAAISRVLVTDNPLRSFVNGNASFAESLAATKGTIQVAVTTENFSASNIVQFELGKRGLLLPTYDDVLQVSVGHMRNTLAELEASNAVFQGWWYDKTTGILHMKYSEPFNGRLKIDFDQSYMSRFWPPET
ncbi:hypothetical protein [Shinella sp. G-2]|uniref:hypothetical protein n=1 Tax=Shinella sp. G-2 TaxID=3133141 RepID=UPI003D081F95